MSADEDPNRASAASAYANTLNASIERMKAARSSYIQHRRRFGSAPDSVIAEFESAIVDLWGELRPFTNESDRVADIWEQRGLEAVQRRCNQVVESTTRITAGGRVAADTSREIERAAPEYLLAVSYAFDDIGNTLGLTVDIAESTPRVKLTDDMVEEVKAWEQRHAGQTDKE